jgi:hypothetical protein
MAERRPRVPIGERVTQAHLDHFCPGGAGLPVTDSGPIGLDPADDTPGDWDANSARAAGQPCARCGHPITPAQDARRRLTGTWVHETCPP